MKTDAVAFKANYVSSPKVKIKSNANGKYLPYPVSFVELDCNNQNDIDAVARVAARWGVLSFVSDICEAMEYYKDNKNFSSKYKSNKFYALTAQDNTFEKLDSDMILGVAALNTYGKSKNTITYLQTHPRYINYGEKHKPDIANIGKSMLRSIKKLTKKPLEVESLAGTILFYEKCGFKETAKSRVLSWAKPRF